MDREFYTYCPLARAKCNHGELSFTPQQEDVPVCAFYDDEDCACQIRDALTALRSIGAVCNTDLGYLNISGSIDTYEQN